VTRNGLIGVVDGFQRRHRWAGFPLAVLYKFFDDQGSSLTALVTYYGFLSLFPLLLLLVTILGFALHGDPHLQATLLNSALAQFPVIGTQLRENVRAASGSGFGLVVGVAGTLYGSLGAAQATQNALSRVWAIPRNERPNPFSSRLRSLGLILVLGCRGARPAGGHGDGPAAQRGARAGGDGRRTERPAASPRHARRAGRDGPVRDASRMPRSTRTAEPSPRPTAS
jgi:hypothetical protein